MPEFQGCDSGEAGELRVAAFDDDPSAVFDLADINGDIASRKAPRRELSQVFDAALFLDRQRGERIIALPIVTARQNFAVEQKKAVFAAHGEIARTARVAQRHKFTQHNSTARAIFQFQQMEAQGFEFLPVVRHAGVPAATFAALNRAFDENRKADERVLSKIRFFCCAAS